MKDREASVSVKADNGTICIHGNIKMGGVIWNERKTGYPGASSALDFTCGSLATWKKTLLEM